MTEFLTDRGQTDRAGTLSFGVGGRLGPTWRPESVEMEDGDICDVFQNKNS